MLIMVSTEKKVQDCLLILKNMPKKAFHHLENIMESGSWIIFIFYNEIIIIFMLTLKNQNCKLWKFSSDPCLFILLFILFLLCLILYIACSIYSFFYYYYYLNVQVIEFAQVGFKYCQYFVIKNKF